MAAGFMAGFGTTMAKLIENDREYFRDRAAKRQEYLQTYGTRAVTDRQDKAAQSMSVVNSLITAGVPKEDVRYVLDKSGIQGLAQLKATIDSRTDLTPEERTTLVKKASDYVANNKDEDFETVINRAWGLYKTSDNPVQRERNIFSAMLGLDANMMEEDVLDDLYVNGYSGRDIYRIMGTSGPKPGEALDLNLPAKRPNSQMLNFTSTALMDQFESSVDAKIASVKSEYAKLDKNDPNAKNYLDNISSLEALKGQGFNGIGTYAKKYDPSLFTFAQTLESQTPGVVTRHPLLAPFLVDYTDYFSEAEDEAKMAAGAGSTAATTAPIVTTTPPGGEGITLQTGNAVMEFETTAEFNTAAAAGNIPAGASVQIGGGAVQTFSPPEAAAAPKTTDLGDMSGAPGFRERDDIKEVDTAFKTTGLGDMSGAPGFRERDDIPEAAPDIDAALDRLPDHLEKLGSQGMDAWRKFTKAVNEYSYTMPSRPLSQRQLTDTPSNTLGFMIVGAMVDTLGEAAETTEDLETFTDVFTRASDTPAYKQLEELIQERKNIPPKKAKKVVEKVQELEVDQAMLGYVQKMDEMGRTPSREEVEKLKTILEQEQLIDTSTDELYRGPISGKTLVEKLDDIYNFYTQEETEYNPRTVGTVGFQDLGLRSTADDVRYPRSDSPDAQTRTRAPLGDTRTDADPTLPASMVAEQMTTRGKKARPSGLMSPPSSGTAPKLGQAEFGDLIDRVHGSSKAAEAFNNKVSSGKVTAADVTRLIKATRKLPNTKSKDKLLNSLFDLRDSLNKR